MFQRFRTIIVTFRTRVGQVGKFGNLSGGAGFRSWTRPLGCRIDSFISLYNGLAVDSDLDAGLGLDFKSTVAPDSVPDLDFGSGSALGVDHGPALDADRGIPLDFNLDPIHDFAFYSIKIPSNNPLQY
ncbi:hypothetical protein EVAR_21125_1 [Eumeta japonica]|uniref:Uncharacterized protein n=1 Tax=Eumeta variegata TaxID=151549 RepID=A0A4C1VTS8_EUMVA|nr:hypothetical protein EVAR_21125_1 [Eumeta japonica]